MKLLDSDFVTDLKQDGTFNETTFAREYESKWSGTVEDAFFNGDTFDKCRQLQLPEYEYSGRSSQGSYYILGMDVGRKGCDSVITVFKVIPQGPTVPARKSLVNIYTLYDTDFFNQAAFAKRLFYKYKAKALVVDGNGLGIGLVDIMVRSTEDTKTGEVYPGFGVINDEDGEYKKYKTNDTELDAMYVIKANAPINTEAHSNAQTQLNTGKVRFLIDERTAKAKLLATAKGQKMSAEERAEYLMPFTLTSILKNEMLNLREDNEGVNIILKQANKGVGKDKFSSFEYGLYYIKILEESKKKKKRNIKDMLFFN